MPDGGPVAELIPTAVPPAEMAETPVSTPFAVVEIAAGGHRVTDGVTQAFFHQCQCGLKVTQFKAGVKTCFGGLEGPPGGDQVGMVFLQYCQRLIGDITGLDIFPAGQWIVFRHGADAGQFKGFNRQRSIGGGSPPDQRRTAGKLSTLQSRQMPASSWIPLLSVYRE